MPSVSFTVQPMAGLVSWRAVGKPNYSVHLSKKSYQDYAFSINSLQKVPDGSKQPRNDSVIGGNRLEMISCVRWEGIWNFVLTRMSRADRLEIRWFSSSTTATAETLCSAISLKASMALWLMFTFTTGLQPSNISPTVLSTTLPSWETFFAKKSTTADCVKKFTTFPVGNGKY